MNKTISILRILIIFALCGFAFLFLFGEEQDEATFDFLLHVFVDKALAVAMFYYVGRLYKRWSKVDPWLKAYDKMCDEVMDNPNPSQL